ncbi:phosphate permease PHO89 [Coccidioides immitis H538.4]|uniref:Phosphate transporter n=1 Tax=Coccidioides immitis H538.4 TaxID=396776 RepID=A0A0J8RW70_COCIT|nr:phosphate permease PHO89 [Coccidioides immitis H538.4]
MAVLEKYDWIIAIISIAFCASSFGNGANDVANSYATSVAARTLTMPQVGVLSMITEFVGAVALGSRVTKTIKNGIIDINRFNPAPATLILGMGCAEVGSAFWLITATSLGFPVSTTQTVVGALIGVGFASQASIKWEWTSGSVSQVAASWGIAPAIAAGFSALIFATIKYSVHNRSDSLNSHNRTADSPDDLKKENGGDSSDAANIEKGPVGPAQSPLAAKQHLEPDERFLAPYRHLAIFHPLRLWSFVKYFLLQGVTRDCVTHDSDRLAATHARAARYDNRVEHLWTYAQVASAMVMSIAHGSNDVANAVGPWVAAYETYRAGIVQTKTDTPIWILVIAGFLLGAGFWFFGFHIIRALGNRITQMSPTRGFSMELGAAITVLLASRLGLPVSTTQCLTGATVGTALMNYDLGAVNWRQLLWIFGGWVLTLPCAGLVSGLLMLMALNTPHF